MPPTIEVDHEEDVNGLGLLRAEPWNRLWRAGRDATASRPTRYLIDVVPAAALAAVAVHELSYDRSPVWQWVLTQGLVWPLVFRRRAPTTVLTWTVGLCLVGWWQHELFTAYLAVLFALHAVAAYRSRLLTVGSAAGVEVGAVLVSVRFGPVDSVNDAIILTTALVATFVLLGTTQQTQRRYLASVQERAAQLAHDADQQAAIAAEQERRRIAREMHDILAHNVSVMIALCEGAAIATATDPQRARDSMRAAAVTGREALIELRRVLSVLRGGAVEGRRPQPTFGALEHLVHDVRSAGLAVELKISGATNSLPEALQVSVFRIVQEGLTNVIKHAVGPTRAKIEVHSSPAEVTVSVWDDGRSTELPRPSSAAGGHGLLGIRERVQAFAGSMTAGPGPEQGWLLSCVLDPAMEG